jgi:hypothetical protein
MSICLSIYLSIYLSYYLPTYLLTYLSVCLSLSVSLWLYSPLLDLGRFFNFLILYTVGRTPWSRDQSVTCPLLTHRTTQTQKKTHTDIHALSGIRTQDPSVRASKDSSCLSAAAGIGYLDLRFGNLIIWTLEADITRII